jgi:hypothetical protein
MVIGGVLESANITGFLENRRAMADEADREAAPWRALLTLWWEKFQQRPIFAKELVPIAEGIEDFPLGRAKKNDSEDQVRSDKVKSLGRQLRSHKDRVYAVDLGNEKIELQIVQADKEKNAIRWKLTDLKS